MIFRRAHKVWGLCVGGKKKRGSFKKAEKRARYAKRDSKCFRARKQKKHPSSISLFTSLFDICAFVFEPQEWSVFFLFFASKRGVSTQNSSFLKHRIHPKHGSGRTSSLTRSNTRKCTSSFYYFVFSVEFFFKRAKLSRCFFSPCV